MRFVHPIPMQEVHNARILEQAGAGRSCFTPGSAGRALAELHKNRGRLAVMRAACLRLAHPEAAAVVGTNLLEGLRSVPKPIPTPSTVQATRLSDGKSAETAR